MAAITRSNPGLGFIVLNLHSSSAAPALCLTSCVRHHRRRLSSSDTRAFDYARTAWSSTSVGYVKQVSCEQRTYYIDTFLRLRLSFLERCCALLLSHTSQFGPIDAGPPSPPPQGKYAIQTAVMKKKQKLTMDAQRSERQIEDQSCTHASSSYLFTFVAFDALLNDD